MRRVLSVCVEDSNRPPDGRSLRAPAWRRCRGGHERRSLPSRCINPKAVRFMAERGCDLAGHASRSLDDVDGVLDAVITMGCGDDGPWIPAKRRDDGALPDPRDMDGNGYRAVRDGIQAGVKALLASL